MELENNAKPRQDIQIREQKIQLPPPVVATNFTVAPHYPTFAKKDSTPTLRQLTLQEVQPEPIVILDEIPAGTQGDNHKRRINYSKMKTRFLWRAPLCWWNFVLVVTREVYPVSTRVILV